MTFSALTATSPCVAPNQISNACSPTSTASPKKTPNSQTKLNPSKPILTKSNPSAATNLAWLSPTKSSSKFRNPSNLNRDLQIRNSDVSRPIRLWHKLKSTLSSFVRQQWTEDLNIQFRRAGLVKTLHLFTS